MSVNVPSLTFYTVKKSSGNQYEMLGETHLPLHSRMYAHLVCIFSFIYLLATIDYTNDKELWIYSALTNTGVVIVILGVWLCFSWLVIMASSGKVHTQKRFYDTFTNRNSYIRWMFLFYERASTKI